MTSTPIVLMISCKITIDKSLEGNLKIVIDLMKIIIYDNYLLLLEILSYNFNTMQQLMLISDFRLDHDASLASLQ